MRVFTCSWSDFFHEAADEWRADAWDVIRRCPEYDWQILTKRPELVAERLPADWGDGWPHVWLGVSIENRRFVHRADQLRALPAAVRFISAEPLLGPLVGTLLPSRDRRGRPPVACDYAGIDGLDLGDGIDWLIVGGESGGRIGRRLVDERNRPREDRAQWVRDLRDAALCSGHRVPVQAVGRPAPRFGRALLDGREWSEFPESQAVRV
jgi:protein gp37